MDGVQLLERLRHQRVAVIGDVMLDHYVQGAVGRVSDEAPVAILRATAERWVLGGAGNVAANVSTLGGSARLVGIVGDDVAGQRIANLITRLPTPVACDLIVDLQRPTTLKTRFIGSRQQMLRVDWEQTEEISLEAEAALVAAARGAIDASDVVVVSDYGKGVLGDGCLAELLAYCRSLDRIVVVDPKRSDFSKYRGATYITPNRSELTKATSLSCETDERAEAAAKVAISASAASILLTRSEKGISLYGRDGTAITFPAEVQEVFDVSGAGDTVVAAFSLALAAGLAEPQAIDLANVAAGVVVSKQGTSVVSPSELSSALLLRAAHGSATGGSSSTPITDAEGAVAFRRMWSQQGLAVGFTNGCFDLLHPGHIEAIRAAAKECDRLIVALNSDASVKRLKGESRPVQGQDARMAVVAGIKGVDLVMIFEGDTPAPEIERLLPDVLVKGSDYERDEVVGADVVEAAGGRIVLTPLVRGHSTTALISKSKVGL